MTSLALQQLVGPALALWPCGDKGPRAGRVWGGPPSLATAWGFWEEKMGAACLDLTLRVHATLAPNGLFFFLDTQDLASRDPCPLPRTLMSNHIIMG